MRFRAAIAAAAATLALSAVSANQASALVRISDDVGGRIGRYVETYSAIRNSGEMVVIDGLCLSACTLVLGIVPRHRICITRNATLGFHAAWLPGPEGKPVHSAVGTQALWEFYPQNLRNWINKRGGLSSKMLFLRGKELAAMYPECRVTSPGSSASRPSPSGSSGPGFNARAR